MMPPMTGMEPHARFIRAAVLTLVATWAGDKPRRRAACFRWSEGPAGKAAPGQPPEGGP